MTAENILDEAVIDTDWNKTTQIKVLLDFIEEQGNLQAFERFLELKVETTYDTDSDDDED